MNPQRTVITLSVASFAIWALSGKLFTKTKGDVAAGKDTTAIARPFIGWAVLLIFLTILADLETTSDLAVAFAWLILIATFMNVGYDGFVSLNKLVTKGF